jgi:PIN domain nuclease of toxin-antitoxin system
VSESASLLLDTNVVIWTLSASSRISARARRAMSRPAASLVVSVVSVWEIVLKHQAGKLTFKVSLDEVVDQIVYHSPWTILPMVPDCLPALGALPMLHSDPFDRLLIAQAQTAGMAILTADEKIGKYKVRTIW